MHKQCLQPRSLRERWAERFQCAMFACLATLLSLPANAGIVLPNDPLTTGSRVPPNILFILDDSGSMANDYMPDVVPTTTPVNIASLAYTRNSLSYNPAYTYQPWTNSDGTLKTGGTSYTNVYTDDNYLTGSLNLANSTRTFYVPKSGMTNAADARQYYRFQIINGTEIVRSEYGSATVVSTVAAGYPQTISASSGGFVTFPLINVPVDAANLTVSTSGGTTTRNGDGAELYIRYNNAVSTSSYTCASTGRGNNETCSIDSPAAGTWYVGVNRATNYSDVTLTATYTMSDGCNGSLVWINCTSVTPTGRSLAAELTNYATWYSYHRTRMKVAKAGAGRAFSDIGKDMRVGFRTIWRRELSGSPMTNAKPILVNRNNGLFDDPNGVGGASNNRTVWYDRLYGAAGNSATPLHSALTDAGLYYSNSASDGAYGPQSASQQLSCRQNFTILTSDGYWNGKDNYTDVAGEQDNNSGLAITNPSGASYQYMPSRPYSSAASDTLADVAMRYWKNDLRTDLDNIVPSTAADPAFWQHMTTFAISIGEKGTLDPKTDLPAITAGTLSWPTPVNNTVVNIDDMWHASVNGHGSFVVAENPDDFAEALKGALSAITERTGSFSSVAANSTRIDTDTRVFQANYVSGVWSGELSAYTITAASGVATVPSWKASLGIPTSGRKIYTSTGSVGATFPTTAQETLLARMITPAVTGANNAAYLKGARNLELQNGGTLRNRNSLLGDIVGSSPAYVKDTDSIYVGANDGMLHGINASNGNELFGYVPAGLNFTELGSLSRPDYGHRYFVDGPTVVSTQASTPGNVNILVGSLGKGGKGVFALDVTNPDSFGASSVKWDKTGAGADSNMGLVEGAPVIGKLNNGDTAVIVSNGINSANDRAVLFIYNLTTGAKIAEIDTQEGSAADPNGLSAPVAWDDDGDGEVDFVYAGDLHGNIWKFDLTSSIPSTWTDSSSRKKLFTAAYPGTPTNIRQPITSGLTVALDPKTYRTWVFFGTGSFKTVGDVTSAAVQSLYGVIDYDNTTLRTELQERDVVLAGTINGKPVRSFEANTPLPLTKKGWFIDLLKPPSNTPEGERIVSDPQMFGSALVVASIIPTSDACQSDGKGYVNALDAFTGTSTSEPFFDVDGDGATDDDVLTNGGGDKLPVGSIDLGIGMGTMPNLVRGRLTQGGSSGGTGGVGIADPRNVGRVSWREVIKD